MPLILALLDDLLISGQNKVTLKVFVEHHQQALTSASSFVKEITSSESYRDAYNSLDISASVSGGFKGFSASVSATYRLGLWRLCVPVSVAGAGGTPRRTED